MQSALIRYIGGRSGGVTYHPPGGQPLVWSNQPGEREHPIPPDEVNYYLNRPTEFVLVPDTNDPRTKQVTDKDYRFAKSPPIDKPILVRRSLNMAFQAFKNFFMSSEVSWQLSIKLKQVHATAWLVTAQYVIGELELFASGDDTRIEVRTHDETNRADIETLRSVYIKLRMYMDQQDFLEPTAIIDSTNVVQHKSTPEPRKKHLEAMSISNPTAFLSYSWDSEAHKLWVRELATRLRGDGIDAKIDQWETAPGDQLTAFMERAIRDNDYVLIVCTPQYKWRSENREGGVGYEGDIMTAEVYATNNHRKFIPLHRAGSWQEAAPSWLSGKRRIDMCGDPYLESSYEEIIRTIHGVLPSAPPLGPIPQKFGLPIVPKRIPLATSTLDLSGQVPPRGSYRHEIEITEQYDKFKRETTVTLHSITMDPFDSQIGTWSVIYTYSGDKPNLPSKVDMVFDSPIENKSKMRNCKEVYFLIDNVPMQVASHNAFRTIKDRGIFWYASVTIPVSDFLKMVDAQHLEGKVCDHEFIFNESQREALKDIASRMQPRLYD